MKSKLSGIAALVLNIVEIVCDIFDIFPGVEIVSNIFDIFSDS